MKLLSAGFLTLACGALLAADDHVTTCETADVEGRYALNAHGFDRRQSPPAPIGAAGTVVFDGAGGVTEWKDVFVAAATDPPRSNPIPRDLVAGAASIGETLEYEVSADCRVTITGRVPTPGGPASIEWHGGLADGGREILLTLVQPVIFSVTGRMKSIRSTDETIDRVASETADVKELLGRVAIRNGLRP